jgi:hypothetical protein
MLPTHQEIVEEAESVLVLSDDRTMYAAVLATAIAGRLNEQAHAPMYEAPSCEVLLAAVAADARYVVRDGVAGLPIVECVVGSSQLRSSGTHRIASVIDDSAAEIALPVARCTAR